MASRDKIAFEHMGKVINRFAMRKTNAFLLATWNELVDATPVDTGAARSNWYITPGRRAYRNNPKDGTKYPRPEEPNVARYTDRWRSWFITNTSPYAAPLNNGASNKVAPRQGWVDEIVMRNLLKFSDRITRPR